MDQNKLKQLVAEYAIKYITDDDMVIGVGTGSTVKYFIDELAKIKHRIQGAVSSSEQSTQQLKACGIAVFDLNSVADLDLYFDGADEITKHLQMIKGGGAALTREKIIAAVAKRFICLADESKLVDVLGHFPVPVEVIPIARSYVARELVKLGGQPQWREGVVTDNGNWILDVYNLQLLNPIVVEQKINHIVGVVTNGIFAMRAANELVLGLTTGQVKIIKA